MGSPPSAVLFDLDGTLIDSAPGLRVGVEGALAGLGLAPITLDQTRAFVGRGARELLRKALDAVGGDPALLDRCHASFLERYLEPCRDPSLNLPAVGLTEALDALAPIPLGLTTNKPSRHTWVILEALGLVDRFGVVVAGDEVLARKPDPEMVLRALDVLGGDPARAWLVGDSAVDAEAARRAGVHLCLVTFGYSEVEVRDLGPDLVVDDLRQLPAALGVRGSSG